MSDLNKVQIIGRLGNDVEMKYTSAGKAIANMSVATGESWTDKQTGERMNKTEWHRVVFFGRVAEVCGEYLRKGSQVYVEGKLETQKWQDRDGNDRYTTQIVGQQMQMLGSKDDSQQQPKRDSAQGGFRQPQQAQAQAQAGGADVPDDIPF